MDPVPTQYIDRDGAALAYQVLGDGPADMVHFFEISQHLDLQWTDPDIHYNLERGEHELKGIPGSWELFAVTHAGDQPEDLPREKSMQTPMDRMALQTARRAPALMRAAVRLGNAIERRRAGSS